MPTFVERRKMLIEERLREYGGDPKDADKYLEYWLKGRLRQVDIEMIIANDCGADSDELAEQFGFSTRQGARAVLSKAREAAGLPPARNAMRTNLK